MAKVATRHEATELGALVGLQADILLARGAIILARDDQAGRLVAFIPDATVVEYTLRIGVRR